MAQWTHPTQFRHFIRRYPKGDLQYLRTDIEEAFKCRFVSLTDTEKPDVKSVYTEDFAERSGYRVYSAPDIAYNASELTLTLRWRSDECDDIMFWSDRFAKYITAQKFEYNDTLHPNRFWQLMFKDRPKVEAERLYGPLQYRFISYKLMNWGGEYYETSQLAD